MIPASAPQHVCHKSAGKSAHYVHRTRLLTAKAEWWRVPVAGDLSLQGYGLLVILVLAALFLGAPLALVVCALSFWHYALYWLAWRYRAVPLAIFRRDAVVMKSVSLIVLGALYFATPLDLWSVTTVGAGFLLNFAASRVLGPDRTYYGHELARLPWVRITAFPYSHIAHPMLFGNIVAFGGTILNAGFRSDWWPLACAHVALNAGLMVMETTALQRRCSTAGSGALVGGVLVIAGAGLGAATAYPGAVVAIIAGATIGGCSGAYLWIMAHFYVAPAPTQDSRQNMQTEGSL